MSYAVQPARRVASKNGDRRYHGPKYRVALCSSISGRSFVTVFPPWQPSFDPTPDRAFTGSRLRHSLIGQMLERPIEEGSMAEFDMGLVQRGARNRRTPYYEAEQRHA